MGKLYYAFLIKLGEEIRHQKGGAVIYDELYLPCRGVS
jgi:hypothetical protein